MAKDASIVFMLKYVNNVTKVLYYILVNALINALRVRFYFRVPLTVFHAILHVERVYLIQAVAPVARKEKDFCRYKNKLEYVVNNVLVEHFLQPQLREINEFVIYAALIVLIVLVIVRIVSNALQINIYTKENAFHNVQEYYIKINV